MITLNKQAITTSATPGVADVQDQRNIPNDIIWTGKKCRNGDQDPACNSCREQMNYSALSSCSNFPNPTDKILNNSPIHFIMCKSSTTCNQLSDCFHHLAGQLVTKF